MSARSRLAFLILVLVQATHSVEEYAFRLYEGFAPARRVSGLVSDDLSTGFAIFNAAFVVFGLGCWIAVVRPGGRWARPMAWAWVVLEIGNATGHALLALVRGGWFPGLGTAPALVAASTWLAWEMTRHGQAAGSRVRRSP